MRAAVFLVLLACVATASALVPLNRGQKVVPSQYVIMIKEGVDFSEHLNSLRTFMSIDNSANEILHQYEIGTGFRGYAIRCSEKVLEFIRRAEEVVELVEEDQYMSAFGVQNNPPSWGLDRISQRNLPLDQAYQYPDQAGAGVNAYTIDTGIYLSHVDYAGRVRWGYTAPAGATNDDKNGHGTHCSGTIGGTSYGVAKKVNLIAVKVLGDLGFGTTADVIAGVNWVANQHTAGAKSVGSMSLGGGAAATIDSAVNSAVDKGVYIVVAAGNDNANACNYSPARAEKAICVGSTDSSDRKSSFSNYGTCVEIHAPGTSITSAWIGGTTAQSTISGTSMACPHVSGVAALYLGSNKVPSIANLQLASTKNVITGLPAGTVNYLLYTSTTV